MENKTAHPILLFDGLCNLCNGSVQFILKRDPNGIFRFASLQSEEAEALLEQYEDKPESLDSVVLLEGEELYARSDAALRVARRLTGLWPLLYAFILIPRPIRDSIYNWIARNRYRWFGKQDQCMMPRPEWKHRFL
jgi:predicted DCC family thiol-disulfide oxidoreductase YuxK